MLELWTDILYLLDEFRDCGHVGLPLEVLLALLTENPLRLTLEKTIPLHLRFRFQRTLKLTVPGKTGHLEKCVLNGIFNRLDPAGLPEGVHETLEPV